MIFLTRLCLTRLALWFDSVFFTEDFSAAGLEDGLSKDLCPVFILL